MPPYRILHIITRLEKGGAPNALIEMVKRLSPHLYRVDLATGQTDDPALDITQNVISSGLSVISIPALRRNPNPIGDFIALWQLVRLIHKGKYHLVHTHTSKAGFLGRIAAWLCRVPAVVHSPHGTVLDGYFSPIMTQFYALLERLMAPISHRIVCLTSREIDQYINAHIGKRSQYTFIYNGITIQNFAHSSSQRERLRHVLNISSSAVVCITVGRLVPVKGQSDLLTAFKLAYEKYPDLYLLMVGDGELKSELENQAQHLGISKQVLFLGWRTDIPDLLAASDIFVLPSLNEGLGLVLIEAMACQLPVVATNVGGVPEVVIPDQTGLLVPSLAPEPLAQAIMTLIANAPMRHQMGQAGYSRCVEQFSIETTVHKTETLYRELLEPAV